MIENALYRMSHELEDRRFEGFAFKSDESVRGTGCQSQDFMPDDLLISGRNWHAPRLAEIWTPQSVIGKVRPFNDFPCVNTTIPAFSERAVDALSEFLHPNGELLPLKTSLGKYWVYNTTSVADVLDLSRSRMVFFNPPMDNIAKVDYYECYPAKLVGLSIFRIIEEPSCVYVTQPFMDRVAEAGLQGFACVKVWPHSLNESAS